MAAVPENGAALRTAEEAVLLCQYIGMNMALRSLFSHECGQRFVTADATAEQGGPGVQVKVVDECLELEDGIGVGHEEDLTNGWILGGEAEISGYEDAP